MNHKQEIKYTVLLSKINNDIQEKLDIPNIQEKLDIDIIKQICYFYYYEGDYLTIYNFLLNKNTVEKNNIILDTTFKLKKWQNLKLKEIKVTNNLEIIFNNLMMIKLKKKLIWILDIRNKLVMKIKEEHLL